jgi:chromosome partitioning protein
MVVAIANHKGGSGKTTTTINLGVALSNLGKKVLIIDLDPQGNLSYSLGIPDNVPTIADVFTGEKQLQDIIIEKEGIDIVPSNMFLADIELSIQGVKDRLFVLKYLLDKQLSNYDYILIDCSPSKSLLTINALVFADKVITTILLDVLSVQGLNQINRTVFDVKRGYNKNLSFLGVLPINVDLRSNISKEILTFVDENFDIPILKSYIRSCVKFAEAPSFGESIFSYAPSSSGAEDYQVLAKEIIILNN